MEVMCVTEEDFTGDGYPDNGNSPKVGGIYTVARETWGIGMKGIRVACYALTEFVGYVFDRQNFATLPEVTASEIEEETREAIIM
jgi:hypothetical protein